MKVCLVAALLVGGLLSSATFAAEERGATAQSGDYYTAAACLNRQTTAGYSVPDAAKRCAQTDNGRSHNKGF